MPEKKSDENIVPPLPCIPDPSPTQTLATPGQTQRQPSSDAIPATGPGPGTGNAVAAKPPSAAETKPVEGFQMRTPITNRQKLVWIVLPVILVLLFALIFFSFRSRQKPALSAPGKAQPPEEKIKLGSSAAVVAQKKALKKEKYLEKTLTDEPYAGQAPLAVRAAGPVLSTEIDPQMAALAEAFKVRVQITQGSQAINRGNSLTRTTKGNFHGFRISALEKLENGVVIFDEIMVGTPKNGMIRTVNHVLEQVQKTSFPLVVSELQDAGLEFQPLPAPAGKNIFRGQLRSVRYWGKPIPAELLIRGRSIGNITLGMLVAQLKGKLAASYGVLKRKVLVNDIYYDVYKVTNQGNEPLFYVYEKEGKVWGISVISEIFKTEMGIGIGSPLALLRISYPAIKLAYSKKKPAFIRLDGVDGIFIIQSDGDQKVISILIGESPEFE